MRDKPFWWRSTVIKAIRQYPALVLKKSALQEQSVTAAYTNAPRGHEINRAAETAALRGLSPQEQNIVDAVERTIAVVGGWQDGGEILLLVDLIDFSRRYTVAGAALALNMSERTARNKRTRFIDAAGREMGY